MKYSGIIEIKDPAVVTTNGTNKQGRAFTSFHQWALVKAGDEIRKMRVRLNSSAEAYPAGHYKVEGPCGFNNYGDPQLPFLLNLQPVK